MKNDNDDVCLTATKRKLIDFVIVNSGVPNENHVMSFIYWSPSFLHLIIWPNSQGSTKLKPLEIVMVCTTKLV